MIRLMFSSLPIEIVLEVMYNMSSLDLIFVIGRVCKIWRDKVAMVVLSERLSSLCCSFNSSCRKISNFDNLRGSKEGRTLVRFLLRERTREIAMQMVQYTAMSSPLPEFSSVSIPPLSVMQEIQILKTYFEDFVKMEPTQNSTHVSNQGNETTPTTENGGIFASIFKLFGGLFHTSSCNSNTSPSRNETSQQLPNSLINTKMVSYGCYGVGKTAFKDCLMEEKVVTPNISSATIGVEFSFKKVSICCERTADTRNKNSNELCELFSSKLQLWDHRGLEFRHSRYYFKNCSFLFLIFDTTNSRSFDTHNFITIMKNIGKEHNTDFKNTEVILIGTMNDLTTHRRVSKDQAQMTAFNEMCILYFDVTNTSLQDSTTILWYLMLMRYFLTEREVSQP
ncbi:hypothetical protein C9374_002756 [Naegleria lovaniensis]|uniref:F-box domain-containing protein n=1 Tax=Naegleria lovaniensis TaxID=51637 RepID=A0AA88GSZ4_NAELO|nr:uncharacterized protein C9374_002756 [Naegleria lovaniensis]KAG2386310.1 hypothetical protein C9374_002756 [Naegleria lovaniensis]